MLIQPRYPRAPESSRSCFPLNSGTPEKSAALILLYFFVLHPRVRSFSNSLFLRGLKIHIFAHCRSPAARDRDRFLRGRNMRLRELRGFSLAFFVIKSLATARLNLVARLKASAIRNIFGRLFAVRSFRSRNAPDACQ